MGLVGVEPEIMRPTALALNILVSGISLWRHVSTGQFSARLFWPIAFISTPLAFIGGRLALPAELYRPVVGVALLYAAIRLFLSGRHNGERLDRKTAVLPLWVTLAAGGVIGLLSGLVGIGGGVLLGPLLLLTGWAQTRPAMGITAAYVLVNSIAGLAGNVSVVQSLPAQIPIWLLVCAVGGWLGAELGSRRLNPQILWQMLALVLVAAAWRMFLD
jgi:uncharacterized membrane protein YfcA